MTKDELQAKRAVALSELKNIEVALCLDELYIDIIEKENAELKHTIAEFGYNKANEWHYVKDELPPVRKEYCGRSELVLVVSKEKEMQYAQYVEKEKTWARGILAIGFEPYAWKEIVLPELP